MALGESNSIIKRGLDEISNKLKTGFHQICCQLNDGSADTEFIPVYEYRWVFGDNLVPDGRFDFEVSGTTVTFNFNFFDVSATLCDETTGTISNNLSYWAYSDSLGNFIEDPASTEFITIDFAEFPGRTITYKFNIAYASGFKYTGTNIITTNGSGVPSVGYTLNIIQNNTNQSAEVPFFGYFKAIKDLLEVRSAGEFVKYVDLDHNDYVPTCMLSYDPVLPLNELTFEIQRSIYNNVSQEYVNGTNLAIPANSIHSISYVSILGTPTINIGGTGPVTIPVGLSATIEGTTLIENSIEIDAATSDDTMYVTIIKP